jgi:hypothetical protein
MVVLCSVLHAEPPDAMPLARVTTASAVRVRVRVAGDGHVTAAKVLDRQSPFVRWLTEEAAYKWRFTSAPESKRTYVLTFVLEPAETSGALWPPEVTREDLSMRVRYDVAPPRRLERVEPRTCPRHHVALQIGVVPIEYGLISPDAGWRELGRATERDFPEANVSVSGGCVVGPATRAEVQYCPACRHAREEWLSRHPAARRPR